MFPASNIVSMKSPNWIKLAQLDQTESDIEAVPSGFLKQRLVTGQATSHILSHGQAIQHLRDGSINGVTP
jgi:hypothetical protein